VLLVLPKDHVVPREMGGSVERLEDLLAASNSVEVVKAGCR
jgi:hypothetical protein